MYLIETLSVQFNLLDDKMLSLRSSFSQIIKLAKKIVYLVAQQTGSWCCCERSRITIWQHCVSPAAAPFWTEKHKQANKGEEAALMGKKLSRMSMGRGHTIMKNQPVLCLKFCKCLYYLCHGLLFLSSDLKQLLYTDCTLCLSHVTHFIESENETARE